MISSNHVKSTIKGEILAWTLGLKLSFLYFIYLISAEEARNYKENHK